jgi:serine protease Do
VKEREAGREAAEGGAELIGAARCADPLSRQERHGSGNSESFHDRNAAENRRAERRARENSPAEKAGIRPGDVIVSLDGESVESVPQLQRMVGFKKPGESVRVTVAREGGKRQTVTVRLGEAQLDRDERRVAAGDSRSGDKEAGTMEAQLGIRVEPISTNDSRAERLGPVVENGGGLVITEVAEDGPGFRRLIPPEGGPDILLSVERKPVRSVTELREALKGINKNDIVTLVVYNARLDQQRVVRLRTR